MRCVLKGPLKEYRNKRNMNKTRTKMTDSMFTLYRIGFCSVSKVAPVQCEQELTFPEFHFETEAKVDFPSACILQRHQKFE